MVTGTLSAIYLVKKKIIIKSDQREVLMHQLAAKVSRSLTVSVASVLPPSGRSSVLRLGPSSGAASNSED